MSFAVYINPSFFERSYKFAITGLLVALIVIIIYDTIEVLNLAKNCVEYPNYQKSSLDFFITIINLFNDLFRAKLGRY